MKSSTRFSVVLRSVIVTVGFLPAGSSRTTLTPFTPEPAVSYCSEISLSAVTTCWRVALVKLKLGSTISFSFFASGAMAAARSVSRARS